MPLNRQTSRLPGEDSVALHSAAPQHFFYRRTRSTITLSSGRPAVHGSARAENRIMRRRDVVFVMLVGLLGLLTIFSIALSLARKPALVNPHDAGVGRIDAFDLQ